jgi:DNA-binding response OmpR family regulator
MGEDRGSAKASPVVLVVENDVLKRMAIAAYFRRKGFEVFEAADVAEATTILKATVVDVLYSNVSLVDGGQLVGWVHQQNLPLRMFWVADTETDAQASRKPLP